MVNFLRKVKAKISIIKSYLFHKDTDFLVHSYSQEGEDILLNLFLLERKNGFYVDIGAHHPFRFSNTFLFYKKGWRGINIDAMPGSMKAFQKYRPRDINIEASISNTHGAGVYYIFEEPALNGFLSEEFLERYRAEGIFPKSSCKINFIPLKDIFASYPVPDNHISFMTIDVEELELEVLKSNDWDKYVPDYIVIEQFIDNCEKIATHPTTLFLQGKGYSAISKGVHSTIFKHNSVS